MDGIHDSGGMTGYGAVAYRAAEPVFHEEWEGRAISCLTYVHAAGISNWDKSRKFRELMGNENYVNEIKKSYYTHWLNAMERLLVSENIFTEEERAKRVEEIIDGTYKETTPANVNKNLAEETFEELHKPKSLHLDGPEPSYSVGDEVVALNIHPSGHTRSPRYVRGHRGRIVTSHGCQIYPDSNAAGFGTDPRPLYTVGFDAQELWGDDADSRDTNFVDLWEPYLAPLSVGGNR